MALTFAYRQAIRNRKRGWRRFEVVFFFALMAMGLVEGCAPLAWSNLGVKMMPYLLVITRVFIQWKQQQVVTVGSLDDRAVAEFGVGFEQTLPHSRENCWTITAWEHFHLTPIQTNMTRRRCARPICALTTYFVCCCPRLPCCIGLAGEYCRKGTCIQRGLTALLF